MTLLKVENLSISFGGIMALDEVSFEVKEREIYAIIGPNGSGKTTIFNCINKLYSPQRGRILFHDQDITKSKAHRICNLGIARTFQNIELFSNMSVRENFLLGCHRLKKSNMFSEMLFLPKTKRQEIQFHEKVEDIIDFLNLQTYRDTRISTLPYGVQKVVEIGRALVTGPKLLMLDEPSSGLNPEETEDMIFWIEDIKKIYGITVLLVEHDMTVVREVSNQVCALESGRVIAQGPPREVQSNPYVIRAYLGDEND